jgi:hypothetical protein
MGSYSCRQLACARYVTRRNTTISVVSTPPHHRASTDVPITPRQRIGTQKSRGVGTPCPAQVALHGVCPRSACGSHQCDPCTHRHSPLSAGAPWQRVTLAVTAVAPLQWGRSCRSFSLSPFQPEAQYSWQEQEPSSPAATTKSTIWPGGHCSPARALGVAVHAPQRRCSPPAHGGSGGGAGGGGGWPGSGQG